MQTTAIRTVASSLPQNEVILLTLLISKGYIPYTDLLKIFGQCHKKDCSHCLFIYYICVISIWTCFVLLYSCVSDFCSFLSFLPLPLPFFFLYQQPLLLSFVIVFIRFFILTVFFFVFVFLRCVLFLSFLSISYMIP